jgi:CheY-like chemotaxis protein
MTKPHVLLVDDSRLILQVGELLLRTQYDVRTALSGAEGLRVAVEQRPDVILTDLNMPGMSGVELAEALASDARTRGIPVVVMTTENETEHLRGMDQLVKPFDAASLLEKVQSCFRRARACPREMFPNAGKSAGLVAC